MPYYAQIDAEGICFAVTETAGQIDQADMIGIETFDEGLLGMKRVDDAWEAVPAEPPEPPPEPGPSRVAQLEQVLDALLAGGETP